jgi:hypothetical protein
MIFFGTLMAAGVVALGEPPAARGQGNALHRTSTFHALNRVADFARPWVDRTSAQRSR